MSLGGDIDAYLLVSLTWLIQFLQSDFGSKSHI